MFYQVLCKKGKIYAKSIFLLENMLFCYSLCKKARNVEKNKVFAKKTRFSLGGKASKGKIYVIFYNFSAKMEENHV